MRLLTPYSSRNLFSSALLNELDHVFEQGTRTFNPACEVQEAEDHYVISLDVPGMKKDDLQVKMLDNVLTISGERKRDAKTSETYKVQAFEKSYGRFERSFALPEAIKGDEIEARFEDGVLEVRLPKRPAPQARQIEIQSGGTSANKASTTIVQ